MYYTNTIAETIEWILYYSIIGFKVTNFKHRRHRDKSIEAIFPSVNQNSVRRNNTGGEKIKMA